MFAGVSGGRRSDVFLHLHPGQSAQRHALHRLDRRLLRRVVEHQEKLRRGFTARHGVARLVWFELHGTRDEAFRRERQIKEWKRVWKLDLSERKNPGWDDLLPTLL